MPRLPYGFPWVLTPLCSCCPLPALLGCPSSCWNTPWSNSFSMWGGGEGARGSECRFALRVPGLEWRTGDAVSENWGGVIRVPVISMSLSGALPPVVGPATPLHRGGACLFPLGLALRLSLGTGESSLFPAVWRPPPRVLGGSLWALAQLGAWRGSPLSLKTGVLPWLEDVRPFPPLRPGSSTLGTPIRQR